MSKYPQTINDLFEMGQIKLAEISVFNWGSFNGLHTARIDPEGTLITGDNGSGKSTFVDGLMALLLPAGKATFNVAAAQGDKSDRSLISYMRGSYGSVHDGSTTRVKSKRESSVVTALRALYRADDGSEVTLAAIFWTTQSSYSLSDVKRNYIIAKRNLNLTEVLKAFESGNARSLKSWLRKENEIINCEDKFSEYQELYRKLLYMDNKNAPLLLSRALGLKKIDDLTALIRELVLEPSSVKEDARKVVEEFVDLVAIHDQLIDARNQKEHLSKLPDISKTILNSRNEISNLEIEKNNLFVYFSELFAKLWQQQIVVLNDQLEKISITIQQHETKIEDINELIERRHEAYLQLGGNKIESIKKDIDYAQQHFNRISFSASKYQETANKLQLNAELEEKLFLHNQHLAKEQHQAAELTIKNFQDSFAIISAKLSKLQSYIRDLSKEIAEIEARPNSNIHINYQQLRDELVSSLQLAAKDCMFVGELIDLKPEQQNWQGAIERALGGLRTTLLVPFDSYSMVTKWLNARHTGLHVRVQVVNRNSEKHIQFSKDGFLVKLIWREHHYRDWLKAHLAKFDLKCVSSTMELDATPFSMTQQGLIHLEKGRFEKKDQSRIDDRRKWYLGFSNKARLALILNDQNNLKKEQQTVLKSVEQARAELDKSNVTKNMWQEIQTFQWQDINAPYWQEKLDALVTELKHIETNSENLAVAKSQWQQSKTSLQQAQQQLKQHITEQGAVSNRLTHAQKELDKAQTDAASGVDERARALISKRLTRQSLDNIDMLTPLKSKLSQKIEASLDTARNRKNSAERSGIGIMSAFRSHPSWQTIAAEWGSDINSLNDYLDYLSELEREGLPVLVEKFVERLNKHATQSLARIRIKLESEREEIVDRIHTINQVLKLTEFRVGTFLKLGTKKEKYPHVKIFESELTKVLNQVTSEDHEARFIQLSQVINILEKASNPSSSHTLESLRLLDPRYQMSFFAEELDLQTGEIRDVLESSSGKSGGEKESFAGTIVAASLAYVLTPDGYDKPVYCTVFLDEAFSNTAESVSKRVLSVFKELNIHVNLITPYKNLNLARESARSLIITEKDQQKHESSLCEITWQEMDELTAKNKAHQLQAQMNNLGVTIV